MAEQRQISIDYTRLSEIQMDPDNPKDHDLGALSESLARFGFVAPMGINENTGRLLWGHGRLVELRQLRTAAEGPPPDGILLDEDGEWLAPVIRGIQLSPEDGKAYLITDNRLVELGGWNERQLIDNLIAIAGSTLGLDGTGYDGDDLDALIIIHGGPPDLDQLEGEFGDPQESDFWPVIQLKVTPEDHKRFELLLEQMPGEEDWQRFRQLLNRIK